MDTRTMPETFTLPRTGDLPLRFEGEFLAESSSHRHQGPGQNRWHELAIYRTAAGTYVLAITYRSCWQGEDDHHWVEHAGSIPAVRDALVGYPVVPPGIGYPPGPAYAEKQARMVEDLRRRYDQAMSALFQEAGKTFAETIE